MATLSLNPQVQRAMVLLQQNRWQLAEQELRQAVLFDPQNAYAHSLLALCLMEQEQFTEATEAVRNAIQLAPDFPYSHYVYARVLNQRNENQQALVAAREAIRLDAADADYRALEAAILLDLKRWDAAKTSAEEGLALDPEQVCCTNIRAMALTKLGRRQDALRATERALARNPENALTHANHGWARLQGGERQEALTHFQEALRLDPENEWARQGILETMKARHAIYALALKYFFWMSRLSSRAQWGVILGGYVGIRLLGRLGRDNPELAPWILPVQLLYVAFVLLTWTADPLFNLLLRLDRVGRLALSREQTLSANWVGTCVALAVASLGIALASGQMIAARAALVFGVLIIPVSGTFNCNRGWPRWVMGGFTLLLAGLGLGALAMEWLPRPGVEPNLLGPFLIGAILSPWVANLLIAQRPRY